MADENGKLYRKSRECKPRIGLIKVSAWRAIYTNFIGRVGVTGRNY